MKKYELVIKEYSSCTPECSNYNQGRCYHPWLDSPTVIPIDEGQTFPEFCPLEDCDADPA